MGGFAYRISLKNPGIVTPVVETATIPKNNYVFEESPFKINIPIDVSFVSQTLFGLENIGRISFSCDAANSVRKEVKQQLYKHELSINGKLFLFTFINAYNKESQSYYYSVSMETSPSLMPIQLDKGDYEITHIIPGLAKQNGETTTLKFTLTKYEPDPPPPPLPPHKDPTDEESSSEESSSEESSSEEESNSEDENNGNESSSNEVNEKETTENARDSSNVNPDENESNQNELNNKSFGTAAVIGITVGVFAVVVAICIAIFLIILEISL